EKWMRTGRRRGWNGGSGSTTFCRSPEKKASRCRRRLRRWRRRECRRGLQRIGEKVMNCATNWPRAVGKPGTRRTGKRSRGVDRRQLPYPERLLRARECDRREWGRDGEFVRV